MCHLWDRERKQSIAKVDTKGGNRPIDYYLSDNGRVIIGYSTQDQLTVCASIPTPTIDTQRTIHIQEPTHGREILAVLGLNQSLLLTGSEDTTFKVSAHLHSDSTLTCHDLKTIQTFSQHEASVRAFSKLRINKTCWVFPSIGAATHLVVSAGSKMQAHVFAYRNDSLNHLCKYH